VAACGVELIQVLAKQTGTDVRSLQARVHGMMDRSNPVRGDYTVFNEVSIELEFEGTAYEQALELAEAFKKR
jgi:hypothetical protein